MDLSQETNSILINWSRHSYHFVSILLQIRENFSSYIHFFLFFQQNTTFLKIIFSRDSVMGLVCCSFNYMYLRKNKIEHLCCFLFVKPQLLKLNAGVKTEAVLGLLHVISSWQDVFPLPAQQAYAVRAWKEGLFQIFRHGGQKLWTEKYDLQLSFCITLQCMQILLVSLY